MYVVDFSCCAIAFAGGGAMMDIAEKVIEFVLKKAGGNPADLSGKGEDIVQKLAGVHDQIDDILKDLVATEIPSEVTQNAVDGAIALGGWFTANFKLTMNAKSVVTEFWKMRGELACIPPPIVENVGRLVSAVVARRVDPMAIMFGHRRFCVRRKVNASVVLVFAGVSLLGAFICLFSR